MEEYINWVACVVIYKLYRQILLSGDMVVGILDKHSKFWIKFSLRFHFVCARACVFIAYQQLIASFSSSCFVLYNVLVNLFVQDASVHPSLVIVYFGGNDSTKPDPSGGEGPHVPLGEYVENMKLIAAHLKVRFEMLLFYSYLAVLISQDPNTSCLDTFTNKNKLRAVYVLVETEFKFFRPKTLFESPVSAIQSLSSHRKRLSITIITNNRTHVSIRQYGTNMRHN